MNPMEDLENRRGKPMEKPMEKPMKKPRMQPIEDEGGGSETQQLRCELHRIRHKFQGFEKRLDRMNERLDLLLELIAKCQ